MLRFSLLLLLLISCNSELKETKYKKVSGGVFGTSYHISYDSDLDFSSSFDSIFNRTNQSLSTYISSSDISRINRGEKDVLVDENFVEVFYKAQKVYQESKGIYDPTIGQVVNAYGFGPEKYVSPPSDSLIAAKMQFVGFDKVEIASGQVVKQYDETYFDFNSVAKGFGVDLVGRFLESKGIRNYLVEIGGEIRARGLNERKVYWTVAVEKPNFDMTRSVQEIISLNNESIATSGNYRKFRVNKETGEKFVHTINALNGKAEQSNLLSASVITDLDCADADAYATAFMAMGYEETINFVANRSDIRVLLIYLDQNGDSQVYQSW